uniref:Uncharacterized protein n=1 Tax=Amphora coffeiformis TaxID=265554 RepID=A0A7S3KYN1_9STRA|mmetsp:Transcript_6540/g.13479  ORF Transcript_6540/g.13479 Transcript_6540/m.13479 type:complete len:604 (-) Transcript_6540:50-1861(-)
MNRSFASFGNRSHGKGLLMLSDDEEESGDENDYYSKAHNNSQNKSISSLFSKQKQSDDDSIHMDDDESDDNKSVKSTKSFLSKVVSKSFAGVTKRRKERGRSKSTSKRRESDGTASTAAPSSPRSSPGPLEMDTSSWGNLDPEESLSQLFMSPEEAGAAQLVFGAPIAQTEAKKAMAPPASPASPRKPSVAGLATHSVTPIVSSPLPRQQQSSSPKQTPKSRVTPMRSKTTGSMGMMFLSDMDTDAAFQLQCAGSMAAPKAAPSKRKKNKDALEAYNAKVAARKAAKEAGLAPPPASSSDGKQKVKIRVKAPKGSDPAMVAAMAKEAAHGQKVPMRIKRSDEISTSPVKKRSTLGRQQTQCPMTPGRTRSAPLAKRLPSVRKFKNTTEGDSAPTTPKTARPSTSGSNPTTPRSSQSPIRVQDSSPTSPQSPRTRRSTAHHRSMSKRSFVKHEQEVPESPKHVHEDQVTKIPTPPSPKAQRNLPGHHRSMSRRKLENNPSSPKREQHQADASTSTTRHESPKSRYLSAHQRFVSKRNPGTSSPGAVAAAASPSLGTPSAHSVNTTRTFSNRRDPAPQSTSSRLQRAKGGGVRSSVRDRIRQFNG